MGRELQGEGNYDAAREYDEQVTKHAKDKAKVEAEAKDAEKALDGPEREELEAAEAEGRSHAKG
jgi:predicted nucleotidyltransferase